MCHINIDEILRISKTIGNWLRKKFIFLSIENFQFSVWKFKRHGIAFQMIRNKKTQFCAIRDEINPAAQRCFTLHVQNSAQR